jgi:enolase-phosphatase E1
VTFHLAERGIQAIVLDIEGTTTPIAFVHDVLFPFARRALASFVREHLDAADLSEPLRRLHREWTEDVARGDAPPEWNAGDRDRQSASIAAYAAWLMDRDRKAFGLKALQGQIWARGYEEGTLHGEVFPDVPAALARWRTAGRRVGTFSSGSVLAQQLLFRTTSAGDLTRWIDAFFDTGVGSKGSSDSYRSIAAAMPCPPDRLLFISDTVAELDAAHAAGCATLLCVRPGNPRQPASEAATIIDLGEVD